MLIARNHELGKTAKRTNNPAELKRIIELQTENNQAATIILALILSRKEVEADEHAAKALNLLN